MVGRTVRHSTAEVHQALFDGTAPVSGPARTLTELKQGIRQHMQRRHALGFSDCPVLEIARKAGHLPLATFDKALSKLAGVQKL